MVKFLKGVIRTKKDLPREGRYELVNPPTMAASEYRQVLCWVTKEVAGLRVVIYKRTVSSQAQFWYWKGGAYFLDTAFVRLFDKKPILIYDQKYTEPMEIKLENGGKLPTEVFKPVTYTGEMIHFATDADMILKGEIVKQAVGGTKGRMSSSDKEKFLWLIVGAIMGVALGYMIAHLLAPSNGRIGSIGFAIAAGTWLRARFTR